jgi:hypothetical protein
MGITCSITCLPSSSQDTVRDSTVLQKWESRRSSQGKADGAGMFVIHVYGDDGGGTLICGLYGGKEPLGSGGLLSKNLV